MLGNPNSLRNSTEVLLGNSSAIRFRDSLLAETLIQFASGTDVDWLPEKGPFPSGP